MNLVEDVFQPLLDAKINVRDYLLISNFSAPLENYKEIIDFCSNNSIGLNLTFSFHEEFTDCTTFFKKLEELLTYCKDKTCIKFKVEMVVTLKNLPLAKKIKEVYSDDRFRINFDKNRLDPKNEVDDWLTDGRLSTEESDRKIFNVTLKSGEQLTFTKNTLYKAIGTPKFPSKNFLCKKRFNNLRFSNGLLEVMCKQSSQLDDIICQKEYCSLCSFKYLEKR